MAHAFFRIYDTIHASDIAMSCCTQSAYLDII